MKDKIGQYIVKHRLLIVLLTTLTVGLSLLPLFKIRVNSNLESYFPDSMPSKQSTYHIRALFNRSEKLVAVLEPYSLFSQHFLDSLSQACEELKYSPFYGNAASITTVKSFSVVDEVLISEPLIAQYSLSAPQIAQAKEKIKENKMVYGNLVSKDFSKALIIAGYDPTAEDSLVVGEFERAIGIEEALMTGLPILREEANKKILLDLATLLPLALLAMVLVLVVLLGDIRSMFLPFSVVIAGTVVAMGLIPLFGWEVSIVGVLVPIMMIAIANNYGIHFVSRYREVVRERVERGTFVEGESGKKEIAATIVNYLWAPVLICGLTTIAGVMGLMMHLLGPIRQMGVVVSLSIAFALLLSLTYVPASISWFSGNKLVKKGREKRGKIEHLLSKVANITLKKPKMMVALFIVTVVLALFLLPSIKVAPDSSTILPSSHPLTKGANILDKEFGGSRYLNIVVSGDLFEPQLLNKIDSLERAIESIEGVGAVISYTNILREIGKAMLSSSDSLYGELPNTREMIAQYLELFIMNASDGELEEYVDFDFNNALITMQYRASTLKEAKQIIDRVLEYTKESGLMVSVGGFSLLEYEMNSSVVKGQYLSLLFAFVVIFILLALIFQDLFAGLMGSLPLFFAVITTMGVMALLGIKLDIVTTIISSISIGLGVDFTIHLFWRTKSECKAGVELREALYKAISFTGRGIAINAFSVMVGFSVLFASAFPMIRVFALLIILSLLFCLVSALVLIPSLTLLIRPKFLTR